jgi:diacylglycerol kinase (ATP)
MGFHAIVNPASGNGRTRGDWPQILTHLESRLGKISWEWTEGPGNATELTRRALGEGHRHILSVGGDGTHNEILNAFLGPNGNQYPEAVLIPISRGTGGDLARTLGFPRHPEKALQALDLDRIASVDAGWIAYHDPQGHERERAFLNVSSLGIGGEVDLRVNRTTKAFGGFASFLWATLATLAQYKPKRVRFCLDQGSWREEEVILIAVANGQFFGGGMWVAPKARIDDGEFHVIAARSMGLLELLPLLAKLYRGAHLGHPKVEDHRARTLVAESSDEVWLDVDGEPLGTLPAEFRILPRALNVVVGPGFVPAPPSLPSPAGGQGSTTST